MTDLRLTGQAPSQMARHFLELLDDVHRLHGTYLEEITTLRARIAELEASKSPDLEGNDGLSEVPDVPGCAVYLVSQDGTIQSWSGGACELYGYCRTEVLGRDPAMLSPCGTQGVSSGQAALTCLRLRKNGSVFEVYPHSTTLLDKAGHACGWMHVEIPLRQEGAASDGGVL